MTTASCRYATCHPMPDKHSLARQAERWRLESASHESVKETLRLKLAHALARIQVLERVVEAARAEHEPDEENNWASSVCSVCKAIAALDAAQQTPQPDSKDVDA